ncbi:MAG TPA: A24 family peptidase [Emcibacteraceae bacterium]|nr:A24 family peptidase [Emcibacteraceae bacterium]
MKYKVLLAFLTTASFLMMFLSERPIYFAIPLWALLSALCYYDFKTLKLPNSLTAAVFLLGIVYSIYSEQNPWLTASSFLISSSFLLIVSFVYYKLRGYHGLGMGDIKLFAAGSVWLSPYLLPIVLLLSSLTAIVYYFLIMRDFEITPSEQKIPYGPFLAIAIWLTWLSGENILSLFK